MLKRCVLRRSVLSQDFPNARLVTLSREKALNALNTSMVDQLATIHRTPHTNQDAHVYILKGAGAKAFCAGGDVVSIVKDTPPGTQAEFFYKEYQVDYHIMTMAQPQVALWDGIVMGGGVGVSIHGKYRVATEKALFAMPETGIGLFPDVGGSWFLPRLPSKQTGLYLSLTGLRLKGADLKHAGLATHYVASEHIAALEAALCNISSSSQVESVLDDFAARTALPAYSLADTTESGKLIAGSFDANLTVEEIIEKLRTSGSDVGTKWAAGLLKCCPTALKVSRELFRRGAAITKPADIFAMEYCATQRAMSHGDFARGVTALLIDKTGNPVWSPATLDAVSDELVESHFTASPNAKTWDPIAPYAS